MVMSILALIATIKSVSDAVPELTGICRTLITVAKEYENDRQDEKAKERWGSKNAAIDTAIADALRLHSAEAREHGQADEAAGLQCCSKCGSPLGGGRSEDDSGVGA
jgi:hypothetical protein